MPRKRPHSPITGVQHQSRLATGNFDDTEYDQNHGTGDSDIHIRKRTRSAEWQSHESWDHDEFIDDLVNKEDKSNLGRPSRFLEGSMNDRVSNTLPRSYMSDEQVMNQYHNCVSGDPIRHPKHHPNSSISHTSASIESNKSSGFFRFGKAVASVFNPVNIWQGFHGRAREKHEVVGHPEVALLRERQAKAEKVYTELKQSGFKGTQGVLRARHGSALPPAKSERVSYEPSTSLQRDSGIDVDSYRSSGELGESGRNSASNDYLLPPPPIPGFGRAASPAIDLVSGKRSSSHLRSPSLQSLKKAISQVHLPMAKHQADSSAPSSAFVHHASMQDLTDRKTIKSQLSRKDLEKQEKLGKKVSDLETKLTTARRELELAMCNDTPHAHARYLRKPLVHGNLPSCSSEHLLNRKNREPQWEQSNFKKQQTGAVEDLDAALAISKARSSQIYPGSGKDAVEQKTTFALRAAVKAEQQEETKARKSVLTKRKGSGGADDDIRYKPDTDTDDDDEWEAGKVAQDKRPRRPRKTQKVEDKEGCVRSDKIMAKGTQQSPQNEMILTTAQTESHLDPEGVDKSKIISMRQNCNSDVPFGQLSEDVVNLRKEYPGATDKEIVNYIASLLCEDKSAARGDTHDVMVRASLDPLIEEKENGGLADGKSEQQQFTSPKRLRKTYSEKTLTKHTSVVHPNEPHPTFLGRPRSTSPLKKDGKQSLRLFSPPPSDGYSKPLANSSATADDVFTVTPGEDGSIPPMPKIPHRLESHVTPVRNAVSAEALSEMAKEQYEWPEDVF